MDAYAWILFVCYTAAIGAVIAGLIGVIRQQNEDFEAVVAVNAELDEMLNTELQANQQLMLERELTAAIGDGFVVHRVHGTDKPVRTALTADELDLVGVCWADYNPDERVEPIK